MAKTKSDLEQMIRIIKNRTGCQLSIETGYGSVQVADERGRNISPLMSRGQLYRWLEAYIEGIDLGQRGCGK